MLGKFIAGDFIAIAGEMRRFPASNENTAYTCKGHDFIKKTTTWDYYIIMIIRGLKTNLSV
jgi:hypothetical protein